MTKYGFDYYLKRAEVLNEMARPSKLLTGETGAKMSEYIKRIGNIIKAGGEIDDYDVKTGETQKVQIPGYAGNPQNRVYRYIINTIADFEGMDVASEEQERYTVSGLKKHSIVDKVPLIALKLLGITDKTATATGFTPNDLLARGFAKWASDNPEKVSSPEFTNELLNPQNILFYLKNNRSANTASGRLKDEKLQAVHGGKSIEDIHAASQTIRPLIAKIHQLQKAEAMRKNPKYQETATGSSDIHNEEIENITKILYNLESYIALKKLMSNMLGINFEKAGQFNVGLFDRIATINDMLPNPLSENELIALASIKNESNGSNVLTDLYDDFEIFLDSGINREEFENVMSDFVEFVPENALPFMEFLKNDLLPRGTTSSDFPGYNEKILQEVLGEDPANWEAFANYYNWLQNEKYRTSKESENKRASKEHSKGFDEYRGMLPDLRRNYIEFINRWKKIRSEKDKTYADSLRVNDGLDDSDTGSQWSDTVDWEQKDKHNESYVMNYMTEQVSKDRFKPRGEFKDRGFKKMNYLEWLEKNQ